MLIVLVLSSSLVLMQSRKSVYLNFSTLYCVLLLIYDIVFITMHYQIGLTCLIYNRAPALSSHPASRQTRRVRLPSSHCQSRNISLWVFSFPCQAQHLGRSDGERNLYICSLNCSFAWLFALWTCSSNS